MTTVRPPILVAAAALAALLASPSLRAQLPLPAVGQPAFVGSGWTGDGYSSIAADVNSDGYPDFVRADVYGLDAALNNGHAVFLPAGFVALPHMAYDIASGDLDDDGDTDFAMVSQSGIGPGHVMTVVGDGVGGFTLAQVQAVGNPRTLALADFDLDGHLDVVVASDVQDASIHTFAGLGDGTLGPPVPYLSAAYCSEVDAGDWDGDGDADVLGGQLQSMFVMVGNGAGQFGPGPVTTELVGGRLRMADMDGDGLLDALNAGYELNKAYLVYRRNTGTWFGPLVKFAVGGVDCLDVERDADDGFPSAVLGWGTTFRMLNNSTGSPQLGLPVSVPQGAKNVSLADFDADGDNDVLAGGWVCFKEDTGFPVTKLFGLPGTAQLPSGMALGDIDGDPRPDVLVADREGSKLFVARGKTPFGGVSFGLWQAQPTHTLPIDIALADANGDGLQDAFVLCGGAFAPRLAVHLANGTSLLDAAQLTAVSINPLGEALGDLDGDALPDAVVMCYGDTVTRLQTLLSTGSGLLKEAGEQLIGPAGDRVTLGDVNGDGFLDALATRSAYGGPPDGDLVICPGDGAGRLGAPVSLPQTVSVYGDVAVRDFDGDGWQDIAVACHDPGALALFRNDGAGGFDAPATGGFSGAGDLVAADVDDDGALDLAVAGSWSPVVYVTRGDGYGGLLSTTSHVGTLGTGLHTLAAADLDSDGKTDLLQLGSQDLELAILYRKAAADNPWASLGGGFPGGGGQPRLIGMGEPLAGASVGLDVDHLAPAVPAFLVLGVSLLDQTFKGGHLVPQPALIVEVGSADGLGKLHLAGTWPAAVPSGAEVWLQVFGADDAAAHGLSATGGMRLRVP